ncbi:phosphate signaling complex protein PhoU [Thermovibrio ammonificans]|jgi:phosphate transport system protein|uniref:Phosphate-specific transport system accessory protein PhoU n=1 Tax=Thermovibrio ammonificans (strain DSM 15698 / JCM 12110 / HB-1) TaxID=648996 RepID=E8T672_THEA1|nr:phosphate signaling complex protein PhoU [Thermovibrio ammonificans]ADU96656.1 phosphate uptake regulator, PhoU [Thermovibrio ammonificans HB-1]
MIERYVADLDELKKSFIEMADMARKIINDAMEALMERDRERAKATYEFDRLIDLKEIEIEERCIRILALYAPEATDLRFVVSILKSIVDLERVGDLARDICETAIYLSEVPPIKPYVDLPRMLKIVTEMLKNAVMSLLRGDEELAREVIDKDDIVDSFYERLFEELVEISKQNPENAAIAVRLILVVKSLERVGDHATNIAEYAIYYKTGDVVKHKKAQEYLKKLKEKQQGENGG